MKAGKTYSNRRIRRKLKNFEVDITNGHYYKRLGINRYNLYEYKHYQTERDIIDHWEQTQKRISSGENLWWLHDERTLEKSIQRWKSWYVRK